MNVLHVSQPSEGGVAGYVVELLLDQIMHGWNVTVACPTDGPLSQRVRDAGGRHIGWPASRTPSFATLGEALRLKTILRNVAPDLVHLHSSKAGLCGRLILRGRLGTIFQPHGWSFGAVTGPLKGATVGWERLGARWADAIVCVSQGEKTRGKDVGIRGAMDVVPNGVDPSVWTYASDDERRAARMRLHRDPAPLVVCIGRLQRQKGQDGLLDAWPIVRRSVPGAELVFVGEGPDEGRIRRRADPGVVLVGTRTDVADWLAAADVVVLPSLSEGMAIVMLEAMARGRSVVATDVPGARDCLASGAGGIVPIGDRGALAQALVTRLHDPRRAAAEGKIGRRQIETTYNIERTRDGMRDVYRTVLRSRS